MAQLDKIKDEMLAVAIESKDAAQIEKAIAAWKMAAEATKTEREIGTDVGRNEAVKFWVPVASTFISSLMLVLAFVFQIYQFNKTAAQSRESAERAAKNAQDTLTAQSDQFLRTNDLTRQAAEDAAFRNVIELLDQTKDPRSAFGMTLLRSFFDSPRYGGASLDMAAMVLGHLKGYDVFQPLFMAYAQHADVRRISDLAAISRNLVYGNSNDDNDINALQSQIDALDKQSELLQHSVARTNQQGVQPTTRSAPSTSASNVQITAQRAALQSRQNLMKLEHDDVRRQLELVSDAMVKVLRTRAASADSGSPIDLHDAALIDADLQGVNFKGADLRGTSLNGCVVKGADFTQVQYATSTWDGTAWWKAKAIDPDLFRGLLDTVPFDPNANYAETTDAADYKSEVERLTKTSPSIAARHGCNDAEGDKLMVARQRLIPLQNAWPAPRGSNE